ncbi:MAG: XdhC family protein [Elusimicrobia bacterium]|nr:XdhC family protein [Elusimicrobiota bacterium]
MNQIERIVDLIARKENFCLATVIASSNPDAPAGTKAIVLVDGTMEGSVGPAHMDRALQTLAMQALADGQKHAVQLAEGFRVFLDLPPADLKLLICGAGHIAVPLARFAREAGFSVTVLDDRADFAHPSRFPGCEVIAEDFTTALRKMSLDPAAYVVVITRGHEHDAQCLTEILPKVTAYVGLIGSRRRGRFVLEALGRKGIPAGRLGEVFTPIGLPIGAESPEEIALSIAAELVCMRRKGALTARALRSLEAGK